MSTIACPNHGKKPTPTNGFASFRMQRRRISSLEELKTKWTVFTGKQLSTKRGKFERTTSGKMYGIVDYNR